MRFLVGLLILLSFIAPSSVVAETIVTPLFSDGFEAEQGDVLNSSLLNWNITAGAVDVLLANNLCGPEAGNWSQCVDLDGTSRAAGTIETKNTFLLDPGLYQIAFDLAGSQRGWNDTPTNTVAVSFGSYWQENFTLARTDPFQTFTRDVLLTDPGSATLIFQQYGGDMIGLLLDNVSISRIVVIPDIENPPNEGPGNEITPTPEPATVLLMGTALSLLFWRLRRIHGRPAGQRQR